MNVEALKILIKYMRALPKTATKHFSMRFWVKEKKQPKKGACSLFVYDKKRLMGCGTTACALGWAGTCKELRDLGLLVKAMAYDNDDGPITNTVLGKTFFDLDDEDFDELFGFNTGDETPKDWADRTEQFLRSRGYIQ